MTRRSTQAAAVYWFLLAPATALGPSPLHGAGDPPPATAQAELLLVVDCLLPGQVRRLGTQTTYVSARRPARLTARDCQIRGGEYVAWDRADARSALAAWLPAAEAGDVEAQVIVGEIHERGIGIPPDPAAALTWYRRAAEAGSRRAQINLGSLYESGRGVPVDLAAARDWYARAAGRDVSVELDAGPPAVPPGQAAELARLAAELARKDAEVQELGRALEAARRQAATLQAQADLVSQRERELATVQAQSARLAAELAAASAAAAEQQQRVAALEAAASARLLAGPELTLIEPEIRATRDIVPVASGTARQVVGRVTAPAGLVALTVNGAEVSPNEAGVFTSTLAPAATPTTVAIVAVDRQGRRTATEFLLQPAPPVPAAAAPPAPAPAPAPPRAEPAVNFGRYHALVIGNEQYAQLPDLATPGADATELAALLESRYGFRTTVLKNASRYQILTALNTLREQLTKEDNLLIYYAGHGELDEVNQRGHWLPTDAERESTANWIPTTAITDILNVMQAKQVLLVVDSCYAGALTRSAIGRLRTGTTAEERRFWLETMAGKRSRTVLTSGGLAPVMDAGGGRHSVFARALLEVLAENREILDGQRLHREVAARVAFAAANLQFDQVPEYAPVRFAGHEAGEFFLVPAAL